MLHFSRWKAWGIILTTLVVCAFAVPNFFPEKTVQSWPQWAQRHIVLGLDLQGGVSILLEVDAAQVRKDKVATLREDVLRVARDNRLGGAPQIRGNTVEFRVRQGVDPQLALQKMRELSQPMGGVLGTTGQRSLDVVDAGNGVIRLTPTEPAVVERIRQAVEQSIQVLEKRLNIFGTVEPSIQRQGVDRILVQVPGLGDPQQIITILGTTAKLEFRLVDQSIPPNQVDPNSVPPDSELLPSTKAEGGQKYLIEKRGLVSGGDLTDAQPGFDQRTSEPIVTFKFNNAGAKKFAQVTTENVGKPFAIVLDNEEISAQVIREAILQGSGQISGNFTVESANNLAVLLRAGALPAKLTVIEQRVVGAGLGQDSIEKGMLASYLGSALVVIFMFVTYGLFGLFANIAVLFNVAT